jgi:hypothetical protein
MEDLIITEYRDARVKQWVKRSYFTTAFADCAIELCSSFFDTTRKSVFVLRPCKASSRSACWRGMGRGPRTSILFMWSRMAAVRMSRCWRARMRLCLCCESWAGSGGCGRGFCAGCHAGFGTGAMVWLRGTGTRCSGGMTCVRCLARAYAHGFWTFDQAGTWACANPYNHSECAPAADCVGFSSF